jgi:uncharacterized repeat protein (TIGR01451 family)
MGHQDKPGDNKAEAKGLASIARAINEHAAATRPESSEKLDEREGKHDKIQVAAVVVAAIYAGLTLLLLLTTKDAVKLTREQVHIGQRAYVIVEHPTFTEPLAIGQPIKVTVELKNTGQTPAIQLRTVVVVDVLLDEPKDISYPTPETVSTIGAGQIKKVHAGRLNRLNEDEFKDVTSKDEFSVDGANTVLTITQHRHVYVYGRVVYKDIFNGDGETEFCGVYIAFENDFVGCKSHHAMK